MSEYKENILVVEDDTQIRNFISYVLKNEGFHCFLAGNAETAMQLLIHENIDVILLDLGLPDRDGSQIIQKVREWSDMPILVISARDQDKEKAVVLDLGADDYLTKPFSATELLARIRVALRHYYRINETKKKEEIYCTKELLLDTKKHQVFLNHQLIHLTPMEYSLLTLLFKNMGRVLTTHMIIQEIWGPSYGEDTQALRALMAALRRKIEQNPASPRYIMTEIGVGYRLAEE